MGQVGMIGRGPEIECVSGWFRTMSDCFCSSRMRRGARIHEEENELKDYLIIAFLMKVMHLLRCEADVHRLREGSPGRASRSRAISRDCKEEFWSGC